MKLAEISPIFKRDDNLCKENYRSINLLAIVSKLFENILSDQITGYFRNLLCSPLSAYRKGYSCQHVILRLTEYWHQALDNGSTVGTVAMDLSRAFDKMPHALLIAKLSAYGMSKDACNLIISYLRNRRYRVKIMGICSDWATINRGVPQGSVLGPLLFNIFLNDLFHVKMSCEIANYADDNHLYYENQCQNTLKYVLENDVNSATTWFENNYMCANPDKFQSIILNRDGMQSLAISVQDKQRVLMHGHQGWNVRHGLCHIYMIYVYIWVVYSFCLFCCLFIIVTTQFVALYKPCKPKPKFR